MQNHPRQPCAECPWRLDVAPGRFTPDRFIDLAKTSYDMSIVQFGCHKSPPGAERRCAGFALRGARHNLGARLDRIDPATVSTAVPLFPNYRAMAVANGVPRDHPALRRCRDR